MTIGGNIGSNPRNCSSFGDDLYLPIATASVMYVCMYVCMLRLMIRFGLVVYKGF
jgi:hypothetical protein